MDFFFFFLSSLQKQKRHSNTATEQRCRKTHTRFLGYPDPTRPDLHASGNHGETSKKQNKKTLFFFEKGKLQKLFSQN